MKLDIRQFNLCYDGRKYYESRASFEEAWRDCERGDWMLWLAARLEIDSRKLARAVALCANTVRHLMKDASCEKAVDDVLAYADGEIDAEELRVRVMPLPAARLISLPFSRSYAQRASSYAVYSQLQSTNLAMWRLHISATAEYAAKAACEFAFEYEPFIAADFAAAGKALKANRRQTADICREVLTEAVFEKVKRLTAQ
jgi:hypothetical protein